MTAFQKLQIIYANKDDLQDQLAINFKLRKTNITSKWVKRVLLAQQSGYQIDDPARFYGFGTLEYQIEQAITSINAVIEVLNKWVNIDLRLSSVYDQDTLNCLHHVFEIEHGLLDQKIENEDYKKYLCDLNLLVHRCESIARGAQPRHVVTYFGLPKTETLGSDDYWHFEPNIKFGTVYINYAEIGKTLYDFMLDNDSYIDPNAFQPFSHFSADFVVRFWNADNLNLKDNLHRYYMLNEHYFKSLGYSWKELSKSIGSIPVADLDYTGDILKELETRQYVKAVHFL